MSGRPERDREGSIVAEQPVMRVGEGCLGLLRVMDSLYRPDHYHLLQPVRRHGNTALWFRLSLAISIDSEGFMRLGFLIAGQ